MKRKLWLFILLLSVSPVYAEDLMDSSKLNMRQVDNLNMSGVLPSYVNPSMSFTEAEDIEYDLQRMKQMNPDFTTYPEAAGIIWLKHSVYSSHKDGGTEAARLYVILGRRGLESKWLNWNIPIPADGSAEVLEADIYDFMSLAKTGSASQNEDSQAGIIRVNFQGLPDTYIIVMSWKEHLPSKLSMEGLYWFQEDLRVWESIVDVYSPDSMAYKTFPEFVSPETQKLTGETLSTWRRINIEPYSTAGELARLQRSGVAFSTRRGISGALGAVKDAESFAKVPADAEALSGFKRSKADGVMRLTDSLRNRETIELAEGSPRKIPATGALTQREKALLAKSWLEAQKVSVSLFWQLPFEPDENTPLCDAMFFSPVLNISGIKGMNFDDLTPAKLLEGAKVFGVSPEGRIISQRVPSSKASDNRLSAVMDLKLNEHGLLSGTVNVALRGAWGPLMLGSKPTTGTARGALLSLFPGLTNYKDVAVKNVKGVPELSFTIENKPGVGGTGRGVLAILPFFEPVAMRKLGGYDAPIEMAFPFVIDQNITLGFQKNASQALVSGKTAKNPDKINYSDSYVNRRHRLIADARFELNMTSISAGNISLLRRHLDNWRAFSSRQIPVR